jgi:hypothetical protein
MYTIILAVLLMLAPFVAHAGGSTTCTTRYDEPFQRWATECSDGARAVTRYDAAFQRYQTEIVRPPKADKPPAGWPAPGKAPRR